METYNMNDEIGKSLGLEPLDDVVEGKVIERTVVPTDDKMDKDYEYARSNFYNVIESGTEALEQMLDVAKASEHPRAYEVVSTIMKTLVDANKDLVKMSTDKLKVEGESGLKKGSICSTIFIPSSLYFVIMFN